VINLVFDGIMPSLMYSFLIWYSKSCLGWTIKDYRSDPFQRCRMLTALWNFCGICEC